MCSSLGWEAHFKDPGTRRKGTGVSSRLPLIFETELSTALTMGLTNVSNQHMPTQSVSQCDHWGRGNGIRSLGPWYQHPS